MSKTVLDPLEQKRNILLAAQKKQEQARHSLQHQIELLEYDWMTGAVHKELFDILEVYIKAIEGRKSPRLLIELPPGFGKTLMVSRHLPAYIWSKHPKWFQIGGTYNQDRADEIGRDFRRVMQNDVFKAIHPGLELDSRTQSMDYLETTKGGKMSFVGVGSGATGKRAHSFVVDDPFKDQEEAESELIREKVHKWFMAVAYTRLLPGAGMIILHTRWNEDDLIGRMLAAAKKGGDQWLSYKFPALAEQDEYKDDGKLRRKKGESLHPERISKEEFGRMKATYYANGQGRIWSALYQQNPVPDDGIVFKKDWFRWYVPGHTKLPKARTYGITTDFATTEGGGDYSVTWPFFLDDKDDIWFLDDIFFKQCETLEHARDIWAKAEKYNAQHIFVEKGVIYNAHKAEFNAQRRQRQLYNLSVIEFTRTKKKKEHAIALANHMQQGKVHFPNTPWFQEHFLPLFLGFDALKVDDPIDAATLPFLSFTEILKPSEDEELPPVEVTTDDMMVRQFIEKNLDMDNKPKRGRYDTFHARD